MTILFDRHYDEDDRRIDPALPPLSVLDLMELLKRVPDPSLPILVGNNPIRKIKIFKTGAKAGYASLR